MKDKVTQANEIDPREVEAVFATAVMFRDALIQIRNRAKVTKQKNLHTFVSSVLKNSTKIRENILARDNEKLEA